MCVCDGSEQFTWTGRGGSLGERYELPWKHLFGVSQCLACELTVVVPRCDIVMAFVLHMASARSPNKTGHTHQLTRASRPSSNHDIGHDRSRRGRSSRCVKTTHTHTAV